MALGRRTLVLLGLWKVNLISIGAFLTRSIHLIYSKVYYTYVCIRRQSKARVSVSILDLLKALQASLLQKMDLGASLALARHCWATVTPEGFSGMCCPTPGLESLFSRAGHPTTRHTLPTRLSALRLHEHVKCTTRVKGGRSGKP